MAMYPFAEAFLDPKGLSTKRVSRACDRCRLKKTKCDGRRCCNRCLADDAICVFSKRKRSTDRPYSSEYVQLLEDQQMKLVEGVQELYRRLRRGEGWTGPQIGEDSQGYPLVQDVLDSLAVLAPSERRSTKRKADDAVELDEDEGHSPAYRDPTVPEPGSPSLSPAECSQSSISSSPTDDYPQDLLSLSFVAPPYHQSMPKQISSMVIGQELCPEPQSMPGQQLIGDDPELWTLGPSYLSSGVSPDFPALMNPFNNTQTSCGWYSGPHPLM